MSDAARVQFDQVPLTHTGPPVDSGEFDAATAASAVRFSQLEGLEPRVAEALARMGVDAMTPVQRGSVPVGLAGLDATVQAETGSGKTLAYLAPLVSRLARAHPAEAMRRVRESGRRTQFPSGLVLCPTRELAQQILAELVRVCGLTPIRCSLLVGGMNPRVMQDQILTYGLHIAVATPGRLLDFLQQGVVSLAACRHLVLDEADRCLDMGFERDIRRLLTSPGFGAPPPAQRQTALFSATFPPDVARIGQDFLRGDRCVTVRAGRAEGGPVPACIRQEVVRVSSGEAQRLEELRRVLDEDNAAADARSLVFVRTKVGADRLQQRLRAMGFRAAAIHGDMGQQSRTMSLDSFKSGRVRVLVATDVAARGLDMPGVGLVVNFDAPMDTDQYVHRVGRTGRLGRPGRAVTFVDAGDLRVGDVRTGLVRVLRACGQPVPDCLLGGGGAEEDGEEGEDGDWRAATRPGAGSPNFKRAVWRGGSGGGYAEQGRQRDFRQSQYGHREYREPRQFQQRDREHRPEFGSRDKPAWQQRDRF